jgi:hypothetical protein
MLTISSLYMTDLNLDLKHSELCTCAYCSASKMIQFGLKPIDQGSNGEDEGDKCLTTPRIALPRITV